MANRYHAPSDTRPLPRWDPQRPEPEQIDEKIHRRCEKYGQNPPRGFWRVETYSRLTETWSVQRRLSSLPMRNAVWDAEHYLAIGSPEARVVDARSGDVVWQETRIREAKNE